MDVFYRRISFSRHSTIKRFYRETENSPRGFEQGEFVLAFAVLLSSLLVLYSVMKIFINGFWGEEKIPQVRETSQVKSLYVPAAFLLALSLFYGLGTEFISSYIKQAEQVLLSPDLYIEAVLKE